MSGALLFYGFGAIAIAAGVAMVAVVRSVVGAAFALAVASAALAGLHLTLGAQLVAVVQLLVHLGAVLVLLVHALLLVGPDPLQAASRRGRAARALGVAAALGLATLLVSAGESLPAAGEPGPGFGGHRALGLRLFGDLGLPLQLLGLLLLAAIVAAASLVRGREGLVIPTAHVLACSAALFFVGAVGALSRRNLLVVLMSILLMGNAVHLSLTGFARSFAGQGEAPLDGQVLAILAIVVGAAETAVALGILVSLVRNRDSLDAEDASLLKW